MYVLIFLKFIPCTAFFRWRILNTYNAFMIYPVFGGLFAQKVLPAQKLLMHSSLSMASDKRLFDPVRGTKLKKKKRLHEQKWRVLTVVLWVAIIQG